MPFNRQFSIGFILIFACNFLDTPCFCETIEFYEIKKLNFIFITSFSLPHTHTLKYLSHANYANLSFRNFISLIGYFSKKFMKKFVI